MSPILIPVSNRGSQDYPAVTPEILLTWSVGRTRVSPSRCVAGREKSTGGLDHFL